MHNKRVLTGTHFMLGNYAFVEGALAAGCDFFAGYPITPANEVSERMSRRMPEVGGKFIQSEDELMSIYSVAGASLCGAKATTATASAGFNYLSEGIGYAVSVEAPCVILDVQRCRGENFATQSDVMQMRWGTSGDYEIICLAPSSVQELFDYTIEAFNLAEKYRNPVIIMSETTIALMREKVVIPKPEDITVINRVQPKEPPEEFVPFRAEQNGVPPMPNLGDGYHILYSLNPHDERGGIDWEPDAFESMYKRIVGKIRHNIDDITKVDTYFLDNAQIVLTAYGVEARPCLDAVERARAEGIKAGLLKIGTVWPVPEKQILEAAKGASAVLSVEMNIGKYSLEIERVCGGSAEVVRVIKNRGITHAASEIYEAITRVAR